MNIGLGIGIPFNRSQMWLSLFSPSSLFANNEQGVWYDPSDLTTLYQDAAGTTPVTAVEQPVGLMLDKSKGLVLGPELVANTGGPFTTAAGWSVLSNGTLSVSGGNLVSTPSTFNAGSRVDSPIAVVAGRTYRLTVNMVQFSGQGATLAVLTSRGGTLVPGTTIYTSTGVTNFVFTPTTTGLVYLTFGSNVPNPGVPDVLASATVRELPGNHAFQTTSTKRPVLSSRVNLLTKTEQFDDAVWSKVNQTVTANQATAPSGSAADLVVPTASGAGGRVTRQNTVFGTNKAGVLSAVFKAQGYKRVALIIGDAGNGAAFVGYFDLEGEGVTRGIYYLTVGTATQAIVNLGDGWYRCTMQAETASTSLTDAGFVVVADNQALVSGFPQAAADGVSGALVADADARPANSGVNLPAYQRVNTATDYDTVGFPTYLKFDGIDDSMQTNSIDFTATDKMTVFAGVRKLSDAATSIFTELSANTNTNNGSFYVTAPENIQDAGNYASLSRGTAVSSTSQVANSTVIRSPNTSVLTATHNISGDLSALRINGAANGTNGIGDKGTGNFGNYPLYIGARAGTSLYFNGHLYNLIVRGAQSTAAQIESTEQWVNGKTAAF